MKSFKEQCIDLRQKDYTLNEIMGITGRGKTSVYYHIKDLPLSREKLAEITENSRRSALRVANSRRGKALRPFKPFSRWTPNMVLLTGHLLFNGELKKSSIYNNRSTALIRRFQTLMKGVYDYAGHKYFNKVTGVWKISYHNVELSNFFKKRSVELKNEIMDMPLDLQKEFLRAFFDDEGCMDFRRVRNLRRVRGYQNDRDVLVLVQKLLFNFGIRSTLQGKNEVVISGKENLIKFQKEINFSKGVRINPNRTNSIWKKNLEKRKLLDMAIKSFKT